jgi:hypothetical protein
MGEASHICSECGQPARVRVLETYIAGKPVIRHFCFRCADRHFGDAPDEEPVHRPSLGSLMVVAGLAICLISLLGGYLGIDENGGFGWYVQSGFVGGVLLVCLGAFWRVDVLGVVGGILIALAVSAKLLHAKGMSGFGWKHQLVLGTGLVLIIAGVVVRQLYYRRLARRAGPPSHGRTTSRLPGSQRTGGRQPSG